jgi:hypothetical protein
MFCVGVVRVSVGKVCRRQHYEFEASKVVFLSWYPLHVPVIVYGHDPDPEKAKEDLCINVDGHYEPIGGFQENRLILPPTKGVKVEQEG